MTSLAWTVAGFVGGAATASVAFLAAPAFFAVPPSPVAAVKQDANPAQATTENAQADAAPPEDLREPVEPALLNADPLGELDVVQRVAMMRWMVAHPQYEFVTRDYCGCLDVPEPQCPEPGYVSRRGDYPYTESRDFNRDGHKDIAMMLGLKGKDGPQELLIFNGPFGDAVPEPVFRREGWRLYDHLYGGFVGPTESDDGYGIAAKGKTYELEYMGNPL
jgi:hypothetical protein